MSLQPPLTSGALRRIFRGLAHYKQVAPNRVKTNSLSSAIFSPALREPSIGDLQPGLSKSIYEVVDEIRLVPL